MAWTVVTDQEGRRVRAELLADGDDGLQLRLEDGQTLLLPHDLIVRESSGNVLLLASWGALEAGADGAELRAKRGDEGPFAELSEGETQVLQLAEETLRVGKRQVKRGRVRIRTRVLETQETVDEPLLREEVSVERVSVGRVVEAPEPVRYEDDLTIIPLYEEVLVVEKRLMLTEELHVRKKRTERRDPQQVTLRREEAVVERLDAQGAPLEGGEEAM